MGIPRRTLEDVRLLVAGLLLLAMVMTASACGSSSESSAADSSTANSSAESGESGDSGSGPITVAMGTPPDTVDPSLSYSTQGWEMDFVVYTPLLEYPGEAGEAGTELIPGLAKSLPQVSADGKTYKLQLRPGLKYSDGTAVKAGDFKHAIERSIKLHFGGSAQYTDNIAGADAYSQGKADSISGIETDDASGDITIHLVKENGAFENILAEYATAPIPSSTPMKPLPNTPPPGVGPYKFGKIVSNESYELVREPNFAKYNIDGVPTGYADTIEFSIQENPNTAVQSVLENTVDLYDPGSALPNGVVPQLQSEAQDRFELVSVPAANFYWLNTRIAPFDKLAVRQAVNIAMDRTALVRLSGGQAEPSCTVVPPQIPGSPEPPCEVAGVKIDPDTPPTDEMVEKAKQMIQDAGVAGSTVTVWTADENPKLAYGEYLTSLLSELGFKTEMKSFQEEAYWSTVENEKTKAQIGVGSWFEDYPNPADFFVYLRKSSIYPEGNQNLSNVADPKLEKQADELGAVPASELSKSAEGWAELDSYVVDQSYIAPIAVGTVPKFTAEQVDFDAFQISPVYFAVYSTLKAK